MQIDKSKTLAQLYGENWGEPEYDSHLVTTIHALHKKPLKDFSAEDLRICIGQHFFDEYLIPIALEMLERSPLIRGDFFPRDLLKNVIEAPDRYWTEHPEYFIRINSIAKNAINRLKSSKHQDKFTLELIEMLATNKARILLISQLKNG
jgi:hypothetical protein